MKKPLLLLTALGASAAAQAQYATPSPSPEPRSASYIGQPGSSLQISGTADVYFNKADGSLTDRTRIESGGNSTSKLIFRGNEALGGGNYATFWLEHGIAMDNGTTTVLTTTNNQPSGVIPAGTGGAMFNRRATVGIGGGWGEVRAGRDWSPSYDTFSGRFDIFGVASGISLNYNGSANNNFVRVSNSVAYVTPTFFGGLNGTIQKWYGENAVGTATVGKDDGEGEGAKIAYDRGPFSFRASYMQTEYLTGDTRQRNVAASWDFGPFRIIGNYNHDDANPTFAATVNRTKEEGWMLAGQVRVGPGDIKAAYSTLKYTGRAPIVGEPEGQKYAIGYVHNLSRRTALYATYAYIENDSGANFAITGATTAPNETSNGFDIGIRHNF